MNCELCGERHDTSKHGFFFGVQLAEQELRARGWVPPIERSTGRDIYRNPPDGYAQALSAQGKQIPIVMKDGLPDPYLTHLARLRTSGVR